MRYYYCSTGKHLWPTHPGGFFRSDSVVSRYDCGRCYECVRRRRHDTPDAVGSAFLEVDALCGDADLDRLDERQRRNREDMLSRREIEIEEKESELDRAMKLKNHRHVTFDEGRQMWLDVCKGGWGK